MTAWAGSDRKNQLPREWHRLRAIVLRRDPTCRCAGCDLHAASCPAPSTDVDHITDRDCHDVDALQGLCHPCHLKKTGRDNASYNQRRAALSKRPAEAHPGALPTLPSGNAQPPPPSVRQGHLSSGVQR